MICLSIDVQQLTIKQKADLIQKLTKEIIDESQSEDFEKKSEINEKISGLFNTFGEQFNSNARSIVNFLRDSD